MATMPETRYARSGDVHIAYQVMGDGPVDVVMFAGWLTHVECAWDEPSYVRIVDSILPWARYINFDKRGVGLSDRVPNDRLPSLEERMDDLRAVLDAVGSENAVLFAIHEAGPMAALFAATYPDRTRALVLYGSHARGSWAPDYPWPPTVEGHERLRHAIKTRWGRGIGVGNFAPSLAGDERFRQWMGRWERLGASPGAAIALADMFAETDVRHVLPSIRVPTLVLHRRGDRIMNVGGGRWMAEAIPGATFVELDGDDHWVGVNSEQIISEVQQFVTGSRSPTQDDRVLATLLFTDIVGSTDQLTELGDARWRDLLAAHHRIIREEIERFRGHESNTAGDGFFATFDGPARAIQCALHAQQRLREINVSIRAGVHTGEIAMSEGQATGLAVHIAARIAGLAGGDDVLVSRTVVDLVAGSGLQFEDRGVHELKGVDTPWSVLAVTAP